MGTGRRSAGGCADRWGPDGGGREGRRRRLGGLRVEVGQGGGLVGREKWAEEKEFDSKGFSRIFEAVAITEIELIPLGFWKIAKRVQNLRKNSHKFPHLF